MAFKHFRFICTLRVIFIVGSIYLLSHLFPKEEMLLISVSIGILILYQIYGLIHYVERTNRDLSRFIFSIKYEDFSQSFSDRKMGKTHQELNKAFSAVANEIRKARSEKEEQYFYLQTVVQHIGIGVISFKKNGDVELINNGAKRLFNVTQLKNIQSLDTFSQELVQLLLQIKAGDRTLIKVNDSGKQLQISVYATEFRMRDQSFTLVTLQNIQSELERERMAKELEIAHQVQTNLLPKVSPQIPGFDIAGFCIPAKETGGDYYDFIPLGKKLGIVIGDVSGKGLPASIYMTLTKGIIHAHALDEDSTQMVLSKMNRFMYQSIDAKSFVTLFYAILDPDKRQMHCSRAGHTPAVLYKEKEDTLVEIEPPGIGLGLESGEKFNSLLHEELYQLQKGDIFLLYTDGITEAMNEQQEFGEKRLFQTFLANKDKSSKLLIDAVIKDVKDFTKNHHQHDDITIVCVKVE